jgi:hypothetical protein
MTPEEFRNLPPEEQLLQLKMTAIQEIGTWNIDFPGRPDRYYVAKIAFQEGKSLGASVAEAIMAEKDLLLDQIARQTEKTFKSFSANLSSSLLIDLMYTSPARNFLIAEEVVRNDEPPELKQTCLNSDSACEELADSICELVDVIDRQLTSKEEGRPIDQVEWEDRRVANQVETYLGKKQMGKLLRASADPLEFIDRCINFKPMSDLDEDLEIRLLGAVADELVLMGRERFYTLYIAATQARSKRAGLPLEERHQESLCLLARKNRPLD